MTAKEFKIDSDISRAEMFPADVYSILFPVNVVYPLGHGRTRVAFLSYVWDESKWETKKSLNQSSAGCARVSTIAVATRPRRELGTHHFHRLLVKFLVDQPANKYVASSASRKYGTRTAAPA
jgi:hypothetical protein